MAAQAQVKAAGLVTPCAGQKGQVDDGAAVHLHKLPRVQRRGQLGNRRAYQVFGGGGLNTRVLIIGTKEQHVIDGNLVRQLTAAGAHPAQALGRL